MIEESGLIELPNGDLIEGHRTDDPKVWGLLDVLAGRKPVTPTTVYKTSGDNASGVVGLLYPSGQFLIKSQTNIGRTFECKALAEESTWAETVWDGASPAAKFIDEDGVERSDGSHGILLGSYDIHRVVERDGPKSRVKNDDGSHRVSHVSSPGSLTPEDPPIFRRAA